MRPSPDRVWQLWFGQTTPDEIKELLARLRLSPIEYVREKARVMPQEPTETQIAAALSVLTDALQPGPGPPAPGEPGWGNRIKRAAVSRCYQWSNRSRKKYPGQCYERAFCYMAEHRQTPGPVLVHGSCFPPEHPTGMPPVDHAWVELPGSVVFDGVQHEFYDRDDYYRVLHAQKELTYTRFQSKPLPRESEKTTEVLMAAAPDGLKHLLESREYSTDFLSTYLQISEREVHNKLGGYADWTVTELMRLEKIVAGILVRVATTNDPG